MEIRNSHESSPMQRSLLLGLVIALIASSLLAVGTDAKRKRGSDANRSNQSGFVQLDPNNQLPVDPGVYTPDPCDSAESALNGFLPQTVTLKKTSSYWAKLTVGQGVSVLACDLSSGYFEVRFDNVTLRQYGKAPIGGWNPIAPKLTGSLRVSFTVGFSPPSTLVLSNLNVLAVSINNFPNSLEGYVRDGLRSIFPDTITITV